MRADRLIALLMLLQSHGSMTAQALAETLEVSERTIYRDINALGIAGIPVMTERGPGGGCSLLDSYRTNLTGLTEEETRALFMLNLPAPLSQLGVAPELKSALLKLSAALPVTRRSAEERVRQRIHLDATWWFQPEEPLPCLTKLYQAIWEDALVYVKYRVRFEPRGEVEIEQLVEPYGLVAKASVW
ncbi:MAG TPA: HTH domain-containing protein [Chloroflexia bacterium]|nr:HTH domain-containing protein [Chloroflexia bacterium]